MADNEPASGAVPADRIAAAQELYDSSGEAETFADRPVQELSLIHI